MGRPLTHGHTTDGHVSPEYSVWASMFTRCYKPGHRAYRYYGGRGVRVCERWRSFENFLTDMGPRPIGTTLDRWPNKDGNYEPGNCRWATPEEQNNNTSACITIEFKGRTLRPMEAAAASGIPLSTIYKRLRRGWPIELVLSTANYRGRNQRGALSLS